MVLVLVLVCTLAITALSFPCSGSSLSVARNCTAVVANSIHTNAIHTNAIHTNAVTFVKFAPPCGTMKSIQSNLCARLSVASNAETTHSYKC